MGQQSPFLQFTYAPHLNPNYEKLGGLLFARFTLSTVMKIFFARFTQKRMKPRLWTQKDKIRLLKRILYFTKNIGHPSYDKAGLVDFLKKYMNGKFTTSQLLGKIKRLMSKFCAIAIKGEEPTTSQSHRKWIVYEISKRIWKDDIGGGEKSQGSKDSAAVVEHEKMIHLKTSKKLALLLEEKRRKLEMMEFELYVKRAELMKRQTQLILQASNKSSSS